MDGTVRRIPVAMPLSVVVPAADGTGFVAAGGSDLWHLDPHDGALCHVAAIEAVAGNRTNDGKCDALGRLWIGTMDAAERGISGSLYRIDTDASVHRVLTDIGVANGLDWSPDGQTFYFTDSMRGIIWHFDFDLAAGTLANRRVFARVEPVDGAPDGLTIDADGFVWSAHWDGARITRYSPDGDVDRIVICPVPRVTSLCFGGADLDQLFVTSARHGLTAMQVETAQRSGDVFVYRPGIRGKASHPARIARR